MISVILIIIFIFIRNIGCVLDRKPYFTLKVLSFKFEILYNVHRDLIFIWLHEHFFYGHGSFFYSTSWLIFLLLYLVICSICSQVHEHLQKLLTRNIRLKSTNMLLYEPDKCLLASDFRVPFALLRSHAPSSLTIMFVVFIVFYRNSLLRSGIDFVMGP